MKSQLIIYFLIISLTCKVNAYDDTNGLIDILSTNSNKGGLSMFKGNENHNNYFIILKNHGIKNNAKFKFEISWNQNEESCHNEDNWSKIKIYKMKTDLPEVLNEYHFDEYKEGEPIEFKITNEFGSERSNFQGVYLRIYCLSQNDSYFIQVPIVTYYPNAIHYDFEYEIIEEEEEKCRSQGGSNKLKAFSIITLIVLLIL
jgi:hypothetical protein